jgi:DNA topoisomerase VI subunit A
MAKRPTVVSKETKARDQKTLGKLVGLADDVAKSALSGREPKVEIPLRTKSNTIWDKKKGILRMGDAAAERELFNLNQAKQFMQTMLHASTIKDLIARREDQQPPWRVLQGQAHRSRARRRTRSTTQDGEPTRSSKTWK